MLRLRILIAAVLGIFSPLLRSSTADEPRRPSVVVLVVDDQGYGDLSCHGNPVLRTPQLDRLHAESVRLTNFHAAPMCTPTRGQLMTGVDALRNGAMNVSSGRTLLRREFPTMAELFAEAGYRCGHFGKWHLGDNYPYRPHDRGFHEAVYYASSHIGSVADPWNNDYFDDEYFHNGVRKRYSGYTTDVFFAEAERFIEASHEAGKPFFVYLPTAAAHGPLFVPQKYRAPYAALSKNAASFFGMIADIDENVGRLDDLLRRLGVRDDVIFIYLTDNGGTAGVPIFNAGMRGKKVELYDGGHRVPCFLRWPNGRLRMPADVAELTECQDLLPTLIELCSLPNLRRAQFDGVNLSALLRGDADRLPPRSLVVQFSRMDAPAPQKGDACVMRGPWRLIGDRELYDVAHDPAQRENVVERHPEIVAQLRADYDAWWAGVAPRVNEHAAIIIGNDAENPGQLSPADWEDVFLDQQRQLRAGDRKSGAWNVEVDCDGEYEITLSRWPLEAGLPMTAAAPEHVGPDGKYAEGKALPVATARLKIADFDATHPVQADDCRTTFVVPLRRGRMQLHTWLYDADGRTLCGAYFAQVRRR